MKMFNYIENENLIRANWLKSFKIYTIFLPFNALINLIDAYLEELRIDPNLSLAAVLLVGCFFYIIIGTALGSQYYYGYKRKGTTFLAWTSLLWGLMLFISALTKLAEINKIFNIFAFRNPTINFYYVLKISSIVIAGFYLYNCWLLYSVNSELRKQNNLPTE